MVALVVVAAALFVLLAWPDTAAAKCPDWLLTGGDLGEYAFKFDACGEGASIERIAGDEVEPPAVDPGMAYAIHDDGWFDPQEYHRFVLHWYPDAGLLFGRAPRDPQVDLDRGDRWMRPDDETRRFLDGAVAEALRRHAAADLEQGLIAANFRARGMADGTYTFSPYAHPQTTDLYGSLTRFTVEPGPRGAEEFVMQHLIEVVNKGRTGESSQTPAYAIRIRVGPRGAGWGGNLGHYTPPSDGEPGQFFPHQWHRSEPNTYFETTPGFDAFIAERVEQQLRYEQFEGDPLRNGEMGRAASSASSAPAADDSKGRWQWFVALSAIGVAGVTSLAMLLRSRHQS